MSGNLAVNPIRLCFFRHDVVVEADEPLYFLFGEYDFLGIQDVGKLNTADASVLVSALTRPNDILDQDITNVIKNWTSGKIASGALIRLDLGLTRKAEFPTFSDLHEVSLQVYEHLKSANLLSMISACSYSIYVLVDLAHSCSLEECISNLTDIKTRSDVSIERITTLPLVSNASLQCEYKNQYMADVDIGISCEVNRLVNFKKHIDRVFTCEEYKLIESLGDFDFHLKLLNEIGLQDLARKINQFRDIDGVHTLTQIVIHKSKTDLVEIDELLHDEKNNLLKEQQKRLLKKIEEDAIKIGSNNDLQKVQWTARRIHQKIGNQLGYLAYSDLIDFHAVCLDELTGQEEHIIRDVTNALVEAYMQRDVYRSLPSRDHDLARSDMAFGPHLPFRVLNEYIHALHACAYSKFTEKGRDLWNIKSKSQHLIISSKSHGFEVLPFSVYVIPYDALLAPCNVGMTWQTLSHELCHSLTASFIKSVGFNDAVNKHTNKICENAGDGFPRDVVSISLISDMKEISAHYLDFIIFFNSNYSDYITSIWSTWQRFSCDLPDDRKAIKYRQYFLRCFAVYMMASHEDVVRQMAGLQFENTKEWIDASQEQLHLYASNFKHHVVGPIGDSFVTDLLETKVFQALLMNFVRLCPLLVNYIDVLRVALNEQESSKKACGQQSSKIALNCKDICDGNVVGNLNSDLIVELIREYHLLINSAGDRRSCGETRSQLALLFSIAGAVSCV